MFFRGKDVRMLALLERRKILEAVVERMDNEFVETIPQFSGDINAHFQRIVANGGEGLIVKDLRQAYGCSWSKMKKVYDVSCVISGFKPGNGKYADSIGSLAISVYHDNKLVEIGFASGFDDSIREDMRKNFKKYQGKVVDVFVQEIQDSKRSKDNVVGRVRHPTFHRFRNDVNAKDCTSEKLLSDLKAAKTKNNRWRKE
jgi:bifunctional non-homologous end joining protein LigD